MQKTCTHCQSAFEISDADLHFYDQVSPQFAGEKFAISPPELCPACRRQRRLLFRNFFSLYHRTCDLTGKKILSMHDEDCSFPVYEQQAWWSDKWDALAYGQTFDSLRPFFDQLQELHSKVPRMAISNVLCENTDYCNLSFQSRNCYLVFGNVGNEDCMYGHIVWLSQNCFDCLYTYRCQYCYECIDCVQCHTLTFSRDCDNCSDSSFLVHCIGCRNCFGCVGLQNKEYHIFNQKHSREEYEDKIRSLNTGNARTILAALAKTHELTGKEIVKYYHGFNCENVTGDYLYNCRNVVEGYDLKNCEDVSHCATCETFIDCQDANFSPQKTEQSYQCLTVGGYHLLFCHSCVSGAAELLYCDNCHGSKNCFGCVGLKNKQYCILNTQYSKEEYEKLAAEIIRHMQKTPLRSLDGSSQLRPSGFAGQAAGYEWGKFMPPTLSPFGYNETIAQEYFPLTKAETLKLGWKWKEEKPGEEQSYMGPVVAVPDDIADVTDDITGKILRCEATGKLFKILPQELAFYRQLKVPLPRLCFMERQRRRFAVRNPRHLWKRECMKCGKGIETTYSAERPERVYCEECYLKEVY